MESYEERAAQGPDRVSLTSGGAQRWPLPYGYAIKLAPETKVADSGRTLIGGSPTCVSFLRKEGSRLFPGSGLRVTDRSSSILASRLLDSGIASPNLDELPEVHPGELTVVIPVKERPDALERTLGSLGGVFPVVVVDDCSEQGSAVRAVAERHGATLLRLDQNLGPAAARNRGLSHVQTPFVAFVDSDVVARPEALLRLCRHFMDPKLALVGPRVVGLPSGRPTVVERYENARSSLDLGGKGAPVKPRSLVSWLPGACMVGRTAFLGAGFAPDFRVGEDVDLTWRLVEHGYHVRYEATVSVSHEHRTKIVPWLSRKAFYGTGAAMLGEQHPEAIAPIVLAPWSMGLLAAVLAQRRWSVPVALALALLAQRQVARKLHLSSQPNAIAARLIALGVASSLSQGMALLLRHWWPLVLVLSPLSRRLRRAVVVAAVVDGFVEWVRTDGELDLVRFAALRRMDDLAYGGGVWWSAIRRRTLAPLKPSVQNRAARRQES